MRGRMWIPVMAIVIGLFAGLACGDDDGVTGPVAGSLVVSLTTPNADDGAIMLTVTGGTIESPAATSASHAFFYRQVSSTSVSAILVGDISAGPLMTIDVPDVNAVASYSATVIEVADQANDLRASLTGYELTTSRGS